jgi:hypothetical protein
MQKERRAGPRGARQMSSAAKSFWRGLDGAQECRREAVTRLLPGVWQPFCLSSDGEIGWGLGPSKFSIC